MEEPSPIITSKRNPPSTSSSDSEVELTNGILPFSPLLKDTELLRKSVENVIEDFPSELLTAENAKLKEINLELRRNWISMENDLHSCCMILLILYAFSLGEKLNSFLLIE